ncbi:MAG: hypothetical protein ACO2O2_14470 [Acidilobaceae archaeon]
MYSIIHCRLCMVAVILPRRIVEGLGRRGVDPGSYIVDLLVRSLSLDSMVGVEAHLELALGCLEEGRRLADGGPVQASGKLYKAGEEVLINDKLVEELGIVVVAAGSGKWRFIDDPVDKVRVTEKPQYWS